MKRVMLFLLKKDTQGSKTKCYFGMDAWARFIEYIENVDENELDCRYSGATWSIGLLCINV